MILSNCFHSFGLENNNCQEQKMNSFSFNSAFFSGEHKIITRPKRVFVSSLVCVLVFSACN